jgi:sulfide:quinone oxidoreductase
MCDDKHAVLLWEKLKTFKGGNVAIGASKSEFGHRVEAPELVAPCEGPIGEAMFMTDYYLRKKGYRNNSRINVFTPGEIFFEDVGDKVRNKVGGVMQERGISLQNNKVLKEITPTEMIFEDGSTIPSDLSIIIPPYKAHCIFKDSGLGDDKGFIPTDKGMRHLDYDNIFAAGDINALAQPKLGHIAVHQADVACTNIIKEVTGEGEVLPFEPEVFCIMNMGGMDATLIFSDVLYGGPHDIAIHSSISRMMKWSFDAYYFYTRGHMPPTFTLKALEKLLDFFQSHEK